MGKRIDWSPYILDRWLTLFFQTYFCYFEPKYKYLTHNNYGFFLVLMATMPSSNHITTLTLQQSENNDRKAPLNS